MFKIFKSASKSPAESVDSVALRVNEAFAREDYSAAYDILANTNVEGAYPRIYGIHQKPLPEIYNNAFAVFEHMAPNDTTAIAHFEKTFAGKILPSGKLPEEGQAVEAIGANDTPFMDLHLETAFTHTVPVMRKAQEPYKQFTQRNMSSYQLASEIEGLQVGLAEQMNKYNNCYRNMPKFDKHGLVSAQFRLREAIRKTDGVVIGNSGFLNGVHRGDAEVLFQDTATGVSHPYTHIMKDVEFMAKRLPEKAAAQEDCPAKQAARGINLAGVIERIRNSAGGVGEVQEDTALPELGLATARVVAERSRKRPLVMSQSENSGAVLY